MKKTGVINFFGGPGVGKTTMAVTLFSLLKAHDVEVELVTEVAKDFTWEERYKTLENQYYIWAKQQHKLWRLKNKVDIIINDSPLLLSFIYGERKPQCFYDLVLHDFNEYENVNFFIGRSGCYNSNGRSQSEKEAIIIDVKIKNFLVELKINHQAICNSTTTINSICDKILERSGIKSKLGIINKNG